MTKKHLIIWFVLAATALPNEANRGRVLLAGEASSDGQGLALIRQQRKEATHRLRRIIFNNDGGDISRAQPQTPEALLEVRTSALAGSQVDAIFYNAVKIFNGIRWQADYPIDPLEVMLKFCRQEKIEIFCSFRMNDIHRPAAFHRDHPACLFGTEENPVRSKY